MKAGLKEETYAQRLYEDTLIFTDGGQNRMKISNSYDYLMTSDSQDTSLSNYKEAKNKLEYKEAEVWYSSHTLSQRSEKMINLEKSWNRISGCKNSKQA